MKELPVFCQNQVFPTTICETIILGVAVDSEKSEDVTWLRFDIEDGWVKEVFGENSGKEPPKSLVNSEDIMLFARAPKHVWFSIEESEERFREHLEKEQMSIWGDFRKFGRITPAILRALFQVGVGDLIRFYETKLTDSGHR